LRISTGVALRFVIGAGMALALPGLAQAQTCFFVAGIPDGRLLGPYTLNSASNDASIAFTTEVGRSYSIDATDHQGPSGGGSFSPAININVGFCPTSDVVAGFTIRDTTNITPTCNTSCSGTLRRSIVSATSTSFLEMRVHNNNASSSAVLISVVETTMFSPAWSTNSTYDTYYSVYNTTNSTCNVTLTLTDTGGTVRSTFSGAVGTGTTLSTNTFALGTARNMAGTARLTHDCPPSTLVGEAAIANFTTPTPYFQFVKFVQAHSNR
jgi:hypothetical protein